MAVSSMTFYIVYVCIAEKEGRNFLYKIKQTESRFYNNVQNCLARRIVALSWKHRITVRITVQAFKLAKYKHI